MPQFAYGLLLPSQIVVASGGEGTSPFAYGSVSGADAYHLARGHTAWTGSTATKLAALIRASAYIDATYGQRFVGIPVSIFSHAVAWPRSGAVVHCTAVPEDLTPSAVINAAYEAALIELTAPGSLSVCK